MKAIFLTALLLLSTNIWAKDELKCAANVREFRDINNEFENKYNKNIVFPEGLFVFSDDFLGQANFTYYVGMDQTFSLFMNVDKFYKHSKIAICSYKNRTIIYINDEQEYFEYYMKNGDLMMANQDFNQEEPNETYDFEIFRAGEIISK